MEGLQGKVCQVGGRPGGWWVARRQVCWNPPTAGPGAFGLQGEVATEWELLVPSSPAAVPCRLIFRFPDSCVAMQRPSFNLPVLIPSEIELLFITLLTIFCKQYMNILCSFIFYWFLICKSWLHVLVTHPLPACHIYCSVVYNVFCCMKSFYFDVFKWFTIFHDLSFYPINVLKI